MAYDAAAEYGFHAVNDDDIGDETEDEYFEYDLDVDDDDDDCNADASDDDDSEYNDSEGDDDDDDQPDNDVYDNDPNDADDDSVDDDHDDDDDDDHDWDAADSSVAKSAMLKLTDLAYCVVSEACGQTTMVFLWCTRSGGEHTWPGARRSTLANAVHQISCFPCSLKRVSQAEYGAVLKFSGDIVFVSA
ncbi:unnamed protein product [Echinostoma caproni]|uniref:Replicase polyprotein 1a n=1 Tax=Echinostoma caproni TaxID=27848 RepID=A0A183AFU8_9TREM|nr:unnamed protein product [Echinostoma caproni]